MKLPLAPYLIILLLFPPRMIIILSNLLFTTKASLNYLGNRFHILTEILIQASELSFFGCIHFWLFYFFKNHLHFSTVGLNVFYISFYFLLFILELYDYQNRNFNMQFVLFSTLKTYLPVFRPRPYFSFPLDLIPRNQYNSLSFLADICFAIIDEPIFWLFFFSFFIPFFICCIYILVKFKLEIFFPSKESKCNTDISCDYHLLIHRKLNKESLNSINFNCNCFKIIHILGLLYITTTVCYAITPVRQRMVNFDSFTTLFNIIFSMTHYEKKLNENIDLLNISRRFLPKDRYWLDNRDDPIYPLVHGDINAYCAYNKKDKKCHTLKKTKE